jgi:hypothetical protein
MRLSVMRRETALEAFDDSSPTAIQSRRPSTRHDARLRPGTGPRPRPGKDRAVGSHDARCLHCYRLAKDSSADLGEVAQESDELFV